MAELTGKTIAELPLDSSISGDELFPVMDNSTSKRVPISSLFVIDAGKSAANLDIDQLTDPGTYYVNNTSEVSGTQPTTAFLYKLVVVKLRSTTGTPRLWQIAYVQNTNCSEYRRVYDGTSWGDWVRTANANDISGVNAQIALLGGLKCETLNISPNSQADATLENSTHGIIVFVNSATGGGGCGIYGFTCSSAGAVTVNAIAAASSLTLTASTNTITVASSSGFTVYGLVMTY